MCDNNNIHILKINFTISHLCWITKQCRNKRSCPCGEKGMKEWCVSEDIYTYIYKSLTKIEFYLLEYTSKPLSPFGNRKKNLPNFFRSVFAFRTSSTFWKLPNCCSAILGSSRTPQIWFLEKWLCICSKVSIVLLYGLT